MTSENLYLAHHGIKGMKWGVRRYQNADGSLTPAGKRRQKREDKKYDKIAKKDAKEFARAKMYYGEGAGNRRKLIKNTVEQHKKENKSYADNFEKHLANQDMAKHVKGAKRERAVNTAAKKTAQTGRGIFHLVMRDGAAVTATAAAVYGVAHMTGIDRMVINYANTKISELGK